MILITQTEFAKKMGVTKSAISKLVAQKKLPVEGKKIIMPDAERAYHLRKSGVGLTAPAAVPEILEPGQFPVKSDGDATMQDLLNAKCKKENALGDLHDTNLKKIKGELLSVEEVSAQVVKLCATVRNNFINLPNKIAPLLVDLSAAEIQLKLDDAVNDILTDIYNLRNEYLMDSENEPSANIS
ncbi:MAG: regulatory phage cox family protein [Burkholderiales bacterium]|nr:regulatory phage cox family protein [Burkholderiales bacterium]